MQTTKGQPITQKEKRKKKNQTFMSFTRGARKENINLFYHYGSEQSKKLGMLIHEQGQPNCPYECR
jgi:hypothetical protein